MDVSKSIKRLGLPRGSYMVVGSGILSVLGIRTTNDIDLIVSEEVFDHLKKQGWGVGEWKDQKVLKHDVFDIGLSWDGKRLNELLKSAVIIDDIPYLNIEDLRKWKTRQARKKDLRDLELIDEYMKSRGLNAY